MTHETENSSPGTSRPAAAAQQHDTITKRIRIRSGGAAHSRTAGQSQPQRRPAAGDARSALWTHTCRQTRLPLTTSRRAAPTKTDSTPRRHGHTARAHLGATVGRPLADCTERQQRPMLVGRPANPTGWKEVCLVDTSNPQRAPNRVNTRSNTTTIYKSFRLDCAPWRRLDRPA